jgi:hypothetical protein
MNTPFKMINTFETTKNQQFKKKHEITLNIIKYP